MAGQLRQRKAAASPEEPAGAQEATTSDDARQPPSSAASPRAGSCARAGSRMLAAICGIWAALRLLLWSLNPLRGASCRDCRLPALTRVFM